MRVHAQDAVEAVLAKVLPRLPHYACACDAVEAFLAKVLPRLGVANVQVLSFIG